MKSEVEIWECLSNEEKQQVLDSFKQCIGNLNYSEICKSYEKYKEEGVYGGWKNPVLLLKLADEKMAHHILTWLYSTVKTSQGNIRIPFCGYFLEEITFDKSSLMEYSEEEKDILRKAIDIIKDKGVGRNNE